MLDHIAERATDYGTDDRIAVIDHGAGNGSDHRAARAAVVMMRLVGSVVANVVPVMRRGECARGWKHQREAENGGGKGRCFLRRHDWNPPCYLTLNNCEIDARFPLFKARYSRGKRLGDGRLGAPKSASVVRTLLICGKESGMAALAP
jgi:hypothetical protein